MNSDFSRWAEEYKKSADMTRDKISELETKRKRCRSPQMLKAINSKLLTLYGMYNTCIYSYRELMRKAEKYREG